MKNAKAWSLAVATALGARIGGLAIRRQGIYFSMVTLALAQLAYFLAIQTPFTGSKDGIQNVPRGHLFGPIDLANDAAMYCVVLVIFVSAVWLLHRAVQSPFSEVLQAIRENEPRAISLGYNLGRLKIVAFVLSAAFAGLAGSLKVLVFQVATLSGVHWHAPGEVVLMTLLDGVGTLLGPLLDTAVVATLQNVLAGAGSWSTVVVGLVFTACVLAFKRAIVGELSAAFKRLRLN